MVVLSEITDSDDEDLDMTVNPSCILNNATQYAEVEDADGVHDVRINGSCSRAWNEECDGAPSEFVSGDIEDSDGGYECGIVVCRAVAFILRRVHRRPPP